MKHIFSSVIISGLLFSSSIEARVPFNGQLFASDGPVKNARVYVKTAKKYALTDKNGKFGLTDVLPTDTLKIKLKKSKEIVKVPVEGRAGIVIYLDGENISVKEDEEMVSIGYGWVPKRENLGANVGISGEELRKTGRRDILSALQGKVAGLNISGDGDPWGGGNTVNIRGQKSFNLSSTPLFLVDDVVVDSFAGINLQDVDYVEVLKDGGIYGSRGANGAILVYTKGHFRK